MPPSGGEGREAKQSGAIYKPTLATALSGFTTGPWWGLQHSGGC